MITFSRNRQKEREGDLFNNSRLMFKDTRTCPLLKLTVERCNNVHDKYMQQEPGKERCREMFVLEEQPGKQLQLHIHTNDLLTKRVVNVLTDKPITRGVLQFDQFIIDRVKAEVVAISRCLVESADDAND